jgi:hypothetical protein
MSYTSSEPGNDGLYFTVVHTLNLLTPHSLCGLQQQFYLKTKGSGLPLAKWSRRIQLTIPRLVKTYTNRTARK